MGLKKQVFVDSFHEQGLTFETKLTGIQSFFNNIGSISNDTLWGISGDIDNPVRYRNSNFSSVDLTSNTNVAVFNFANPSDLTLLNLRSKGLVRFNLRNALNLKRLDISANPDIELKNLEFLNELPLLTSFKMGGLGYSAEVLDFSSIPNLEDLVLENNDIDTIILDNNYAIKTLGLYNVNSGPPKTLDFSNMPNLTTVRADSTNMESLTLGTHDKLKSLRISSYVSLFTTNMNISYPNLTDLFFGSSILGGGNLNFDLYPALKTFTSFGSSKQDELDFKSLPSLIFITSWGMPNLNYVNVTGCPVLRKLNVSSSIISSLDLSNNTLLEELLVTSTDNLTTLNLSNCANITKFEVQDGGLSTLTGCSSLSNVTIFKIQQTNLSPLYVDEILIDLDDSGCINTDIHIDNIRTTASDSAVANLESRGATFTYY